LLLLQLAAAAAPVDAIELECAAAAVVVADVGVVLRAHRATPLRRASQVDLPIVFDTAVE
jgi:hypothetical protein